jgi:hypothetical protein
MPPSDEGDSPQVFFAEMTAQATLANSVTI